MNRIIKTLVAVLSLSFIADSFGRQTVYEHIHATEFSAPTATDTLFVYQNPQTTCTDGTCTSDSIIFGINTTRFLAQTDIYGHIRDSKALVGQGNLSRYAVLKIAAFDVNSADNASDCLGTDIDDEDCTCKYSVPERDYVFFDGTRVDELSPDHNHYGYLRGARDVYTISEFLIPIEKLKFPYHRGIAGSAPTPASNQVEVRMDQLGLHCKRRTHIAWATLSIKTVSPIVLVHGNSQTGEFFTRRGTTTAITKNGWLWDNSISLSLPDGQDSISNNAGQLRLDIPRVATEFGVNSIHILAHSKGGLDSREYLAAHYTPPSPSQPNGFHVLSLTTLSTPHNGSALADGIVRANAALQLNAINYPDDSDALFYLRLFEFFDSNPGYPNLVTDFVQSFNRTNIPALPSNSGATGTRYYAEGGDVDQTADGSVDWYGEIAGLPEEDERLRLSPFQIAAVNRIYQYLGHHTTFLVSYVSAPPPIQGYGGPPILFRIVQAPPTATFAQNDALVTVDSALGKPQYYTKLSQTKTWNGPNGINHSTIAATNPTSYAVARWMKQTERSIGDLK